MSGQGKYLVLSILVGLETQMRIGQMRHGHVTVLARWRIVRLSFHTSISLHVVVDVNLRSSLAELILVVACAGIILDALYQMSALPDTKSRCYFCMKDVGKANLKAG